MFNRFGKLKRTAALNDDGLGLGLKIISQIAEKAHGSVYVRS